MSPMKCKDEYIGLKLEGKLKRAIEKRARRSRLPVSEWIRRSLTLLLIDDLKDSRSADKI